MEDINKIETTDTRYQYPYVELEYVIDNPTEYIIPQCLPACEAFWNKNIETFMVSNNDDKDLYVLIRNISNDNKDIIEELIKSDSRFFFDEYRKTYGIGVNGNDLNAMNELTSLVEFFQIQDTMRFKTADEFLEEYKCMGGPITIDEYGYLVRHANPELANVSLKEALKNSGKENLFIEDEGKVYESKLYLEWHQRYQKSMDDALKSKSIKQIKI